ncbi:MAG TPA: glycerate kinase [Methylomirabilota bacterium]|nr:glycerate kinase [Methylomirabilota bacterium]
MRVLIVPDKFKGTLTAKQAAEAIAAGWRAARPLDELELLPMSDGGDGYAEVFGSMLGARQQMVQTVDAAHQPRAASWWFSSESKVAVVETAQSNGLALLPPGKFHPFQLDTWGVGELLKDAARQGARTCYAGVGGSATNDGGFGMARALGWKFIDHAGREIAEWTKLEDLKTIHPPSRRLFDEVWVANDVQNPLLGIQGASRIYGPQKGLKQADFALAEACLGGLAEVCRGQFGIDYAAIPGAGAAGGLGFGMVAFAGGKFRPGFELFAEVAHLDGRIGKADLVISAEGAIDEQTAMGKGVGGVAVLCAKQAKPCFGLAGALLLKEAGPFTKSLGIYPHLTESTDRAKAEASVLLAQLAERAARDFKP